MRILIDYRPALWQRTGVGEYVHGLAAALAGQLQSGDSLTLFSSSWKDRLALHAVAGTREVDRRVPVRLLNFAWHRLKWPPVESFAGNLEVVHSLHPLLIPSRRAAQLVTVHDLHFIDRPEHTTAEIRRDYPSLARDHARRADGVIVNSSYTGRRVIERFGIDPARVTVCYPGNPGWTRHSAPGSGGHILFVGTAGPRKNLGRLIEAYEALRSRRPDAPHLVIAGSLPESATSLLARSSPVTKDRIRITGYVSDDERQALYRNATLLVLPSLEEGFGIPALEAMTAGVPVVASNRGALPEVTADAAILVDPEDAVALGAAIQRVLDDPALRQRMSEAGIQRAAQFTWEASAARLYSAYRDAWGRRSDR